MNQTEIEDENNGGVSKIEWDFVYGNLENLDADLLRFIFKQAETKLQFLVNVAESFRSRSIGILAFLVTILFSISAFIPTHMKEFTLVIPLMTAGTLLFISALLCAAIITSRKSTGPGSSPADLLHKDCVAYWLAVKNDKTITQEQAILFNECLSYEDRIAHRKNENDQVGLYFKYLIFTTAIAPIVAIAFFVIIHFSLAL